MDVKYNAKLDEVCVRLRIMIVFVLLAVIVAGILDSSLWSMYFFAFVFMLLLSFYTGLVAGFSFKIEESQN